MRSGKVTRPKSSKKADCAEKDEAENKWPAEAKVTGFRQD